MRKKLLLVQPPFYRLYKETYSIGRFPLALGYIAGHVQNHTSWEVSCFNADFTKNSEPIENRYLTGTGFDNYLANLKDINRSVWSFVRDIIKEKSPSVVGISANTQSFKSACRVAQIVKEINDKIIVVIGGPHVSFVGVNILDCEYIDIGVVGEGEHTIVDLLEAIEKQSDLSDVKGIIFRKDANYVVTPSRDLINDLDTLPFPHQTAKTSLVNYKDYSPEEFRYIFTSRGCPFNCLFCGSRNIWGRKPRYRSPENIVEELKSIQKIGVSSIHFDDDTFGLDKSHAIKLCNLIKQQCPSLKWSIEIHVKLINDDFVKLMKSAGCYAITLGIESGNNDILKKIRKNITIEEALKAGKIIRKHGMHLAAFFMVGFPWETKVTFRDTIKAIKKLRADIVVYSIFTPYPGTEAFDICKKSGLIDEKHDFSLFNHQSPLNCFCNNIPKDIFRSLCIELETMVDKNNKYSVLRKIFSLTVFKKIKELGVKGILKKLKK